MTHLICILHHFFSFNSLFSYLFVFVSKKKPISMIISPFFFHPNISPFFIIPLPPNLLLHQSTTKFHYHFKHLVGLLKPLPLSGLSRSPSVQYITTTTQTTQLLYYHTPSSSSLEPHNSHHPSLHQHLTETPHANLRNSKR